MLPVTVSPFNPFTLLAVTEAKSALDVIEREPLANAV